VLEIFVVNIFIFTVFSFISTLPLKLHPPIITANGQKRLPKHLLNIGSTSQHPLRMSLDVILMRLGKLLRAPLTYIGSPSEHSLPLSLYVILMPSEKLLRAHLINMRSPSEHSLPTSLYLIHAFRETSPDWQSYYSAVGSLEMVILFTEYSVRSWLFWIDGRGSWNCKSVSILRFIWTVVNKLSLLTNNTFSEHDATKCRFLLYFVFFF